VVLLAIGALELSFIILLLFMLGLSGLIGFAVIVRMVEPKGARAMAKRVVGLPPKKTDKR
jgi:hypothetical protein